MSVEFLTWDSGWWGVPIGRSTSVADIDEHTVVCLWLLLPAANQGDIQEAEHGGAEFMDVRVGLDCTPTAKPIAGRPFKADDLDGLAAIARGAFRGLTRFYAEPRFADVRCDDLYENWLQESACGWAQEILVIGDGEDPAGFVTIHLQDGHASIGLIALAEHVRGRGLGLLLTNSAIGWAHQAGAKRMTVVTQGCNITAQRAFQAAGFRVCSTDVWMHRWR